MGDQSPSEFYRKMENISGTSGVINDKFLKTLWLKRLPDTIRAVVMIRESDGIKVLTELADKIWETSSAPTSRVDAATSSNAVLQNLISSVNELKSRFDKLEMRQSRFPNRRPSRNRTFSRPNSRSRDARPNNYVCWFHRKFGGRATKCKGGDCSFGTQSNNSNRPEN